MNSITNFAHSITNAFWQALFLRGETNLEYVQDKKIEITSPHANYMVLSVDIMIFINFKKVCHPAPATLEPISQHSRTPGVESFSNFDGL